MRYTYSPEDLKDVLICAIEGGINYWAQVESYSPESGHAVIVDVGEQDDTPKRHEITLSVIRKGIKTLLGNDFQVREDIAEAVITKDNDAETADCIIQAALFGELVYG